MGFEFNVRRAERNEVAELKEKLLWRFGKHKVCHGVSNPSVVTQARRE